MTRNRPGLKGLANKGLGKVANLFARQAGSRRRLASVAIGCSALLGMVSTVVIVGMQNSDPPARPKLLSGATWLPSERVGQLTLLDAASAEVPAQIQVANAGQQMDVVHWDSNAVVVTPGAVRSVNGATLTVGKPVSPIPGAGDGMVAKICQNVLYVLDTKRGVLMTVDPKTFAPRGPLIPMGVKIRSDAVTVDNACRFWVINADTGDLVWVDRGKRQVRRHVADPARSQLVSVGDTVVVVDPGRRSLIVLDPGSGRARKTFDLDVRSSDEITIGVSWDKSQLYVVASRGAMLACSLKHGCAEAIPLPANARFGRPVATSDRVLIPRFDTGSVLVVDQSKQRVVDEAIVVPAGTEFSLSTQLALRSRAVFNNPKGPESGVLRMDGGHLRVSPVAKYDANNPASGLTNAGGAGANQRPFQRTQSSTAQNQPQKPAQNQPQKPAQTPKLPQKPAQTPKLPQNQLQNPGPAAQSSDSTSGSGTDQSASSPAAGTDSSAGTNPAPVTDPSAGTDPAPIAPKPLELQIGVPSGGVQVDEQATFSVSSVDGSQLVSADWSFGDNGAGSGLNVSHAPTQVTNSYWISVTATAADGRSATTGVAISVTKGPPQNLTVNIAGEVAGGFVEGNLVACNTSTCSTSLDKNTSVDLKAVANEGYMFVGWEGGCSGTRDVCVFTIKSDTTVTARFKKIGVSVVVEKTEGPEEYSAGLNGSCSLPAGKYKFKATVKVDAPVSVDFVWSVKYEMMDGAQYANRSEVKTVRFTAAGESQTFTLSNTGDYGLWVNAKSIGVTVSYPYDLRSNEIPLHIYCNLA